MASETTRRIYELQVKLASESVAQIKKVQQAAKDAQAQFKKLEDGVAGFGKTLLAGFSVQAIVAGVAEAIKAVDDMGAAAQRLGLGVEAFSALAYAAKQSDMSVEQLEIGLKELQKSMVETTTKGAKVLDALGIDKTKPQIEVLKDFAEAFKTIQDPALQTNALLEVFGKSGLALRPLLEQGAEGIDKLTGAAVKLGAVITEDTLKVLGDLDNVLKNTKETTDGLMRSLAVGLAPALTDLNVAFQSAGSQGEIFKAVGTGIGGAMRAWAVAASLVVFQFKQVGTTIAGTFDVVSQAIRGNVTEAKAAQEKMRGQLAANWEQQKENMKQLSGLAANTDMYTLATDENTVAVKNNNAGVRAALADGKKDKEAKKEKTSEFEKLTKALDDQLFTLQQVGSETSEYDKALRAIEKVFDELTPAQRLYTMAQLEAVRAQAELNKDTKAREDDLKELEDLLKSTRTEQEKFNDEMARYEILAAQFPEYEEAIREAIERRTQAHIEATIVLGTTAKDTEDIMDKLGDKIDGYAKDISSTFVDFVSGANDAKFSFSDFAMSVLRDLAKMTTQFLIIEPLMASFKNRLREIRDEQTGGSSSSSGIGKLISSFFGGGGDTGFGGWGGDFALGGAGVSPSLSRYSGKVYHAPRMFEFAHGAGVFAEAGPEAIMPLKRGPDGSLGVQASGGGGGVVVNVINQAGADVDVQNSKSATGEREVTILIQQAVADGFARGRFDGVMGATYGMSRRGR